MSQPVYFRRNVDLSWQAGAACAELDPRDFDQPTVASALTCPDCPVRRECVAARMHPAQQVARREVGAA